MINVIFDTAISKRENNKNYFNQFAIFHSSDILYEAVEKMRAFGCYLYISQNLLIRTELSNKYMKRGTE